MIIDLILDRRDAERNDGIDRYGAHTFYTRCMQYGKIADEITRAMDYGTEEDVVNALCAYIDEQDYNPEIKDYIRSKSWMTPFDEMENLDHVKTYDDTIVWLYKLEYASRRSQLPHSFYPLYALQRYVGTGRSSIAFDKALCKANPEKLMGYIIKQNRFTDDEMLAACRKYLRRYCGYRE